MCGMHPASCIPEPTGEAKGDAAALLTGFALTAAIASSALAQDLPKSQFKGDRPQQPDAGVDPRRIAILAQDLPERQRAITADITPLDQMGIDDKTMLRLLKLGVMDFAAMDISKMAGDDPRFEACDLAGLTLDPDKARPPAAAYRDVIDRRCRRTGTRKLLAFGGNTPRCSGART